MPRKRIDLLKVEPSNGIAKEETTGSQESERYGLALDALKPSAGIASALEASRSKDLATALEASKAMRSVQYGSAGIASALEAFR
ncbi:hypothetical protein, partial [Vogesella mureinivorans]|uniref:hypothetical protein n=1 Tax=Vogesella mureinivorans TaxID=657276 RepID=UPI00197CF978